MVDSHMSLMDPVLDKVQGCQYASDSALSTAFTEHLNATWPGSQGIVTILSAGDLPNADPPWLDAPSFAGVVEDRGNAEIRFIRTVKREGCFVRILVKIPLAELFLNQLSRVAGLEIAAVKPVMLSPYWRDEGIAGEIEANFIPGSLRPVPVVVVARNWQTGASESWVICHIRPSYARTIEDLSRMGLRTASWVSPLITIAFALGLVYACGIWFSLRLSRRIVTVIDTLSHAAHRIGMGDFSIRIPMTGEDQLGSLVGSFNAMTSHLESLREQERYGVALERDMTLAREAQQYLYPRSAPVVSGAKVCGITTPARIVSGDLPIGLFSEITYREFQLEVSRGCAIVVYSDGLIDALNSEGEEFGEERLVDHCRSLPKGAKAQEICTHLSQCIAKWSTGVEQYRRYNHPRSDRGLLYKTKPGSRGR